MFEIRFKIMVLDIVFYQILNNFIFASWQYYSRKMK